MATKPTTDLGDFWLRLLSMFSPPQDNVSDDDMTSAKSMMRQQWRQLENQTLEQQRNESGPGLQSWYGRAPYGGQTKTLGDIWGEEARQKQLMDERARMIMQLIGRPR